MICRSDADSNSPLVTCHVFKFSFDPYNALTDVDAILQMRKKRYREVERFTQGCTASIRAQLSQDFGVNTQTLVKLKQSWGSLVPSVTNSYRKKLHLLTHRHPHPSFYSVAFLAIWSASTWGCFRKTINQIHFCNKATRPSCGLYFPQV